MMTQTSPQFDVMVEALKKALNDENPQTPLLVKRIPFICQDIRDIKSNMQWHRWLLVGIAGGIGLLALKQLGV